MRVRVQVVIEPDDGGPAAVHEVAELERGALQIVTLGLQLAEAKELLRQGRGRGRAWSLGGGGGEGAGLPGPALPLPVGLDGGYVHACRHRSRREGWFEVIAGKSVPTQGPARCFGFVQTYDPKPKRRLFEALKSQGMQANQQVTFLTDGGEDARERPLYLNPQAEHLLAWFHITMRLTVMGQMAKGLGRGRGGALELATEVAS